MTNKIAALQSVQESHINLDEQGQGTNWDLIESNGEKQPQKITAESIKDKTPGNEITLENVPDFMSTRSTLPYLENNRSKSD